MPTSLELFSVICDPKVSPVWLHRINHLSHRRTRQGGGGLGGYSPPRIFQLVIFGQKSSNIHPLHSPVFSGLARWRKYSGKIPRPPNEVGPVRLWSFNRERMIPRSLSLLSCFDFMVNFWNKIIFSLFFLFFSFARAKGHPLWPFHTFFCLFVCLCTQIYGPEWDPRKQCMDSHKE